MPVAIDSIPMYCRRRLIARTKVMPCSWNCGNDELGCNGCWSAVLCSSSLWTGNATSPSLLYPGSREQFGVSRARRADGQHRRDAANVHNFGGRVQCHHAQPQARVWLLARHGVQVPPVCSVSQNPCLRVVGSVEDIIEL